MSDAGRAELERDRPIANCNFSPNAARYWYRRVLRPLLSDADPW
jgi:hypothetical protein